MRTSKRTIDSINFWSGILFGLGAVAFIDETIFHQLLHWHHFYDKSTTSVGLVSDGLFHAFSWFATVAALFMVGDLRRRNSWQKKRWFGAYILGAGVFQLYDGIIQHKLMRLHQIRYNVEIFYYDLVWNVIAAIMIVIGLTILKSAKETKVKVSDGKIA
ncbi:DUF2243 domain-containing protein [Ureibacillus manganicus]|uniref:Membrane protein n=1 Tax=Ureibacillus manganicus DSM 26584 TaxID=1384049 RepID=A0A0A3IME3_9BACL|nr:DUF2243 domain-containing protein [Ureibacillus manganicus]KGR76012.1 membrane protein [Ureibacillus manganicus DSM 26584]